MLRDLGSWYIPSSTKWASPVRSVTERSPDRRELGAQYALKKLYKGPFTSPSATETIQRSSPRIQTIFITCKLQLPRQSHPTFKMQFKLFVAPLLVALAMAAPSFEDGHLAKRTCGTLTGEKLKICQEACKAICVRWKSAKWITMQQTANCLTVGWNCRHCLRSLWEGLWPWCMSSFPFHYVSYILLIIPEYN